MKADAVFLTCNLILFPIQVTIFQECQPEFLHDLVLKMKAYIFTPGDLICRQVKIDDEKEIKN